MFRRASLFAFLHQIEASSARSRESLTPLVPVWQLGLEKLAVLFILGNVQLDAVLEEAGVQGLSDH